MPAPSTLVRLFSQRAVRLFARSFTLLLAMTVVSAAAQAQSGLDYRQRETYKIAESNLENVEGNLEQVGKQIAAATAKDAPQMQANIDALNKYLKQANDQIAKLPADNADVKGLINRAADGRVAIEKLQADLQARISGTQGAVNAEMAQFEADVDKLAEWGKAFSDAPNLFHQRPDDAVMLVTNIANVEAEWKAIQARNAALLDPKNHDADARKIQAAAGFFDRSFPSFKQYMAQLVQELPASIDQNLQSAQQWMDRAVADKNPLLIINGVSQDMAQADRSVLVLKAINQPNGAKYEALVNQTRAKAVQAQATLRESIIQATQTPAEQYSGADVAALREQVKAAWVKAHPDARLLAVVFNTPGWNRVTRWEWSLNTSATGDITGGTWRKVDYDVIQPKAIVRFDDRLAVIYPVDVYKDHTNGDQIAIKPWDVSADPDVKSLLLLERVPK